MYKTQRCIIRTPLFDLKIGGKKALLVYNTHQKFWPSGSQNLYFIVIFVKLFFPLIMNFQKEKKIYNPRNWCTNATFSVYVTPVICGNVHCIWIILVVIVSISTKDIVFTKKKKSIKICKPCSLIISIDNVFTTIIFREKSEIDIKNRSNEFNA